MPVYKPNPLKEFWNAIREWWPSAQTQALETWETLREEPQQIWNSVVFRCVAITLGGIILIMGVRFSADLLLPKLPANHKPISKTANFEVFCSNLKCNHKFLINRPFGYDDFPVKCPKCSKETGERPVRCDSKTCQGRLVLPKKDGEVFRCSRCGSTLNSEG